jgi:Cys-tRNA(Pro) deacylase
MNATDLARYLSANDIDAEIVFLDEETPTVESAAAAVGVKPEQIIKSVLFVVKEDEETYRPLLVVANGLSRIDYKKLAAHLEVSRRRVRIARPDQVAAITGYPVGTVPPFGHKTPLPTLVEAGVMVQEEVYAGAGAINALVHLSTTTLQQVVDGEIIALTAS